MPTIDLDTKQLARAVRQLSSSEFREFLKEFSDLSRLQFARHRDERTLRAAVKYRLPASKQRRLSTLLEKSNEGTITIDEEAELRELVSEVEQRSLEKAEAMYELLQRGIDMRPGAVLERCAKK